MHNRLFLSLALLCGAISTKTADAQPSNAPPNLTPYYTFYGVPGQLPAPDPVITGFPPEVRVFGGGVDPPPIVTSAGSFATVERMLSAVPSTLIGIPFGLYVAERRSGVCQFYASLIAMPRVSGEQSTLYVKAEPPGPLRCRSDFISGEPLQWMIRDRVTFLAPIRRTAIDGSEYDASPMVLERGGQPWMTYFAGYRLGFVAGESNWLESNAAKLPELAGWPSFPNARDNFELIKLPPPFVEGEVVEYFTNVVFPATFAGRFGYAASSEEQKFFDASPEWIRTGQNFKSGGYVAVCSVATGAALDTSTRLYSAYAKECAALAASPVFPVVGTPIRASRQIPATASGAAATCPAATVPLYRLFNNGMGAGKGIGHRFLTSNAVRQEMVRAKWIDEGVVMCVPQ